MKASEKVYLGIDVFTAAVQRIEWVFDNFSRIYIAGPSGKDSGAMTHLVCREARKRSRRVGLLYVDLEAQYKMTIEYVQEMFRLYSDVIEPYWVAMPLRLRNAVSMLQPYWVSWDPECADSWVRQPPPNAITDPNFFPFYQLPPPSVPGVAREGLEFEEFVEGFGQWYAQGEGCACFVGLRCEESLNRWRAIVNDRDSRVDGRAWTCRKSNVLVQAYPLYDWSVKDIWTAHGREKWPYDRLYDLMYKAGLTLHQMRICQPFGDDQRRSLAMYQIIEPDTWARLVDRVSGANSGALYAGKRGNILGNGKVTLPSGHTWKSFTRFLLDTLPSSEREHYENKIAVFCKWYADHGVPELPDAPDPESDKKSSGSKGPSWYRVARCILKNDRMCRSLGFSQHRGSYEKYTARMKKRRAQWGEAI